MIDHIEGFAKINKEVMDPFSTLQGAVRDIGKSRYG